MEECLARLRLKLHRAKSQLTETRYGLNFVGFRVLPDRIRVRRDNLERARRRFRQLQQGYGTGEIDLNTLAQRLQSWEAHVMHGDTYRLRRKIFDQLVFTRDTTAESSKIAMGQAAQRGLLEQQS